MNEVVKSSLLSRYNGIYLVKEIFVQFIQSNLHRFKIVDAYINKRDSTLYNLLTCKMIATGFYSNDKVESIAVQKLDVSDYISLHSIKFNECEYLLVKHADYFTLIDSNYRSCKVEEIEIDSAISSTEWSLKPNNISLYIKILDTISRELDSNMLYILDEIIIDLCNIIERISTIYSTSNIGIILEVLYSYSTRNRINNSLFLTCNSSQCKMMISCVNSINLSTYNIFKHSITYLYEALINEDKSTIVTMIKEIDDESHENDNVSLFSSIICLTMYFSSNNTVTRKLSTLLISLIREYLMVNLEYSTLYDSLLGACDLVSNNRYLVDEYYYYLVEYIAKQRHTYVDRKLNSLSIINNNLRKTQLYSRLKLLVYVREYCNSVNRNLDCEGVNVDIILYSEKSTKVKTYVKYQTERAREFYDNLLT